MGGLVFLAPLHAFGAWLFAAFLLMHVYLTTTGPTPLANIQAMVVGWEGMETVEETVEAV
jgi:thiosulfate reductase cytochrome b subunit